MIRLLVLSPLLFLSASCSLTEGGEPLTQVWRVEDDISDYNVLDFKGALDGDRFYLIRGRPASSSATRELAAFDRDDGEVAWRVGVTQPCSPPVAAAGRVFCPASALYAFEAATGRALWALPTDSSLSLVEGTADAARVFAGSLTSAYAADAATGALLWRRHFTDPAWRGGVRLRSFTLAPNGDLLIAMEALFRPFERFSAAVVMALDPATGEERWRYVDGGPADDRAIGSLTLWNGLALYSDAEGNATSAEAVAFDLATREVRWRAASTPGFLETRRAPAVVDGVAYFTDGGGCAFAVDAATGARRWAERPSNGGFFSHEACGPYLLGNNSTLVVVDRATGARRGVLLEDESVGQVAVGEGRAYISTSKGVYAFDCG